MTKTARVLCAILLIVSAFLMFVPIATFEDNSAAALQEEIDKQTEKLGEKIGAVYGWEFPTHEAKQVKVMG